MPVVQRLYLDRQGAVHCHRNSSRLIVPSISAVSAYPRMMDHRPGPWEARASILGSS